MTGKNLVRGGRKLALITLLTFVSLEVLGQVQDARFLSDKYRISIVPPKGWTQKTDPAVVVQFLGNVRKDKTQPGLLVFPVDADDPDAMAEGLIAILAAGYLRNRGSFSEVVTKSRRKIDIGGFNATQLDISANSDSKLILLRFTTVPVKSQKRIYVFAMQDAAEHFNESVVASDNSIATFRLANSMKGAWIDNEKSPGANNANSPSPTLPSNSTDTQPSAAMPTESRVNVDDVSNDENTNLDLSRLNLFAEQYDGKNLYLTCLKYGGLLKNDGIFCLRLSDFIGAYISPVLKRDGITFVTTASIASRLLDAYIRSSEMCQINLGFRVEKISGYWVAMVFEVGVRSSLGVDDVISDNPDLSLIAAGKRGDKYTIESLLKWSRNIDTTDRYGKTALMYAAENGHTKTTKTLLEKGANVNIRSTAGLTALAYARNAGKRDTVQILEKAGAK